MRAISYVGCKGECIVIEKPEDLYPMLDWIQSRMMDFVNDNHEDKERFEKCSIFLTQLMNETESAGFGDYNEVDKIQTY